jgi:hypothetical protein
MDVLMTNGSDPIVVAQPSGIAPILSPIGELPNPAAVSPLDAALAASRGAVSEPMKNILGVDLEDSSVKNLIFISLVAWAFWKWGKRL